MRGHMPQQNDRENTGKRVKVGDSEEFRTLTPGRGGPKYPKSLVDPNESSPPKEQQPPSQPGTSGKPKNK